MRESVITLRLVINDRWNPVDEWAWGAILDLDSDETVDILEYRETPLTEEA